MHPGGKPFEPQSADPFGTPYGPGSAPPSPGPLGQGTRRPHGAPSSADYNTFAVLSPIFAVVVPPAGVVLGHLALPQIRRTGERGRAAAIAGLVIGYLMCLALIAALIWWLTSDSQSGTTSASTAQSASASPAPPTTRPRPSTVTSVAPPSTVPRIKLDLATVPIGACVEIQLRSDEGGDALDLFKVDCEHKEGVYTVTARVSADYECRSVYVAAPPDHSFALCLNPY